MVLSVTRADIAAALDGLAIDYGGAPAALAATPYRPAALAVWAVWPDWQSAMWINACVVQRSWQVFVILPAVDPPAWTEATDAVLGAVHDALVPLGQVQRAEPIALVAAEQALTMPAVAFTLVT